MRFSSLTGAADRTAAMCSLQTQAGALAGQAAQSDVQRSPPSVIHIMGYYSFSRPWRDGRLSWPWWLTDSRRHTHKVVKQPSISLAQDKESLLARTDVLTTMLHHQLKSTAVGLSTSDSTWQRLEMFRSCDDLVWTLYTWPIQLEAIHSVLFLQRTSFVIAIFWRMFVQTVENNVLCDYFWCTTGMLYGVFGIVVIRLCRPAFCKNKLWLTVRVYGTTFYTNN